MALGFVGVGLSAGGLSASSRSHGLLTCFCLTRTSCSASSNPFWLSFRAFSSYLSVRTAVECNERIEKRSVKAFGRLVGFAAHMVLGIVKDAVEAGLASRPTWQGNRRIAELILVFLTTNEQSREPESSRRSLGRWGGGEWHSYSSLAVECSQERHLLSSD